MTGYSSVTLVLPARIQATTGTEQQITITLSLKSLNSRFFEATCKLPYALNALETDIVKYLRPQLIRGNIFFSIHLSNSQALASSIEPSLKVITHYLDAVKKIKTTFDIQGALSLSDLMTLPHVFDYQDTHIDEETRAVIMSGVEELTALLIQSRAQEGTELLKDFYTRIRHIEAYFKELTERAAVFMEQKKQQLFQTLQAITQETGQEACEANNLAIYHQLERIDINEEIVRFNSHMHNLTQLLQAPGIEKGKKIDFTLQELFREINTIASKCSDAQISSLSINIKVELEKMREQAQNSV